MTNHPNAGNFSRGQWSCIDRDHFVAEINTNLTQPPASLCARTARLCTGSSAETMNVRPLHPSTSNLNVLIEIILYYANSLPGMMLWSAGTVRLACFEHFVRARLGTRCVHMCSGRPLEQRATVRDPLRGSIGTWQEC